MITYKCNIAGPYHIDRGIPCQDSFSVITNERFSVLAVADGLGSELYSDIGASVAAHAAVNYVAEHFESDMQYEEIQKSMKDAYVYAYRTVLERAKNDGNDPDEYDTTLCLAVYDGKHLFFAQSGDSGLVALLEDGNYLRVTSQQRDEEGRVFPLCCGPEKWEFGYIDSPVSSFMLMTDGVLEQICPKLLRNNKTDINIPLARKFLDRFDCTHEDVPALEKAVCDYLENYPKHMLDDDKTVVVLVNPDLKPAKKEESYYDIPDWRSLREKAERILFPNGIDCLDSSDDEALLPTSNIETPEGSIISKPTKKERDYDLDEESENNRLVDNPSTNDVAANDSDM